MLVQKAKTNAQIDIDKELQRRRYVKASKLEIKKLGRDRDREGPMKSFEDDLHRPPFLEAAVREGCENSAYCSHSVFPTTAQRRIISEVLHQMKG